MDYQHIESRSLLLFSLMNFGTFINKDMYSVEVKARSSISKLDLLPNSSFKLRKRLFLVLWGVTCSPRFFVLADLSAHQNGTSGSIGL